MYSSRQEPGPGKPEQFISPRRPLVRRQREPQQIDTGRLFRAFVQYAQAAVELVDAAEERRGRGQ